MKKYTAEEHNMYAMMRTVKEVCDAWYPGIVDTVVYNVHTPEVGCCVDIYVEDKEKVEWYERGYDGVYTFYDSTLDGNVPQTKEEAEALANRCIDWMEEHLCVGEKLSGEDLRYKHFFLSMIGVVD